jgi:hypothetical protein
MLDIITNILGMTFAIGLFYGATLLLLDKQKAWKKRELERNDSSRSI